MESPPPTPVRLSPTLYDVARDAGVSTATVSRVVHGQDSVSPATKQRVQKVIEVLGYVPDSAAQSMARGSKEVIGLLPTEARCPDTEVEHMGLVFTEEVLRGVESALVPLGWPVLVSNRRPAGPADAYQWLQRMSAKVDGLLITEGFEPAAQLAKLASRIPVVLIAGSPDALDADVIAIDNRAGIRALVSHLIERHGRTRLWYVDGPAGAPDARERRAAFEEALAQHQGVRLAGRSDGRFAALSGQQAVREILATGEAPDAIVCANDQTAIGAIQELRAAGTAVPGDICVTGFDDLYLGAVLNPTLTTVHQPIRRLGERACSLLLERIANPGLPRRVELLPTRLVVRESCGCPAGGTEPDDLTGECQPLAPADRLVTPGIAGLAGVLPRLCRSSSRPSSP